ncbi:MAG: ArdC family protein [Thermomicrobiales bacterium]
MSDSVFALDQLETAPLQLKIDQALQDLSEQLARGHTDHFRQVLTFYAKFHHYSMANAILIMQQKPDAEVVAGYRRWQELGHQVRKNTKSAQIWCPVIRKDAAESEVNGTDERVLVGFRTGYVFSDKDLIDAETLNLPTLRSQLPDTQADLLLYIREKVEASGVSVRETDHIRGAEGYYDRARHQIVLESAKDSHNQVLVLLHEWAHALFHRQPEAAAWPQAQKEFEAETVTVVLANILGIAAPAASDYLLVYGATPEQLKQSMGHIHRLVTTMTKALGLTSPLADPGPRDARPSVQRKRDWK